MRGAISLEYFTYQILATYRRWGPQEDACCLSVDLLRVSNSSLDEEIFLESFIICSVTLIHISLIETFY